MSILTLPPELLAAIIGHLDTTSVSNLYAAGVACIQGLVTECHFSANALATANSLNTDFFTGVSGYLKVLNLSGVPDLDAPCLLGALVNMNSLVDLDVSYTNITMADFLGIAAKRPTLKSIAINFSFVERNKVDIMDEVLLRIKETALPEYQQAWKRFKNVHFVGSLGSRVYGRLALLMLQCAELNRLTFTTSGAVEGSQVDVSAWRVPMVNTAQFQLYSLNTQSQHSLLETPIYIVMDFKKYEVIIFWAYYKFYRYYESEKQRVFATPVLEKIICEQFGASVEIKSLPAALSLAALHVTLAAATSHTGSDFACLFWDVDRTEFDSAFRSKLLKIFKEYYVFVVDASAIPVPAEHEWCRVTADPRNTLDYNVKFYEKEKVKLKIVFNKKLDLNAMPKIDRDRDFLEKVTHLSLCGMAFTHRPKFVAYFKALLESCSSLETLQLAPAHYDITFLQHLKEAKRLRNILVYSFYSEQTCLLLTYLSQCGSLENIYLYQSASAAASLERLSELVPLVSKLSNLYNFCLNVFTAASDAEVNETCQRVTSELGRDALRVVLSRGLNISPYYPYLSVFSLLYRLNPNSIHGCNCNVSKMLTKR